MSVGLGVALIVSGALLGSVVMLGLWRTLDPAVAFALLGVTGVLVAAGGLLVQEATDVGSWVIAVGSLAALGPLHGRLVLGPPGTQR